jgi:hypothetical protein
MVASLKPLGTAKSQPRSVASGGKRNCGESRFRHTPTSAPFAAGGRRDAGRLARSLASTIPLLKDIDVDSERQPSSRRASEERRDSF